LIFDTAPEVEEVRELFEEYSRQIGVDLCVQNFGAELAGLPGYYELILVARDGSVPAGCAALRPFPGERGSAELKRLYVRQAYRGSGLGRRLTQAMIEEARGRGYRYLRLDTLPSMHAAIAMYRSMGFQEIKLDRVSDFVGQLFFRFEL
jgi:putative acetyltransferase